MKNLFKTFIAVAIVAVTVQSCKKGEEDGALSLRSRKSRLAGEWKVDSYVNDSTVVQGLSNKTTSVFNTNITGNSYTQTLTKTGVSGTNTTVGTKTTIGSITEYTFTIEKDGTWTSKKVIKITSETITGSGLGSAGTEPLNITSTTERSGTWQFLGKNKNLELKNKEAVAFSINKETTTYLTTDNSDPTDVYSITDIDTQTYAPNEMVEVWTLSKLANSELVGNIEFNNTTEGSSIYSDNLGTDTEIKVPNSATGTAKITLKQ